jgi:CelD/BcsL family acetyltransferase involved in cellulose biosynthesis/predicted ATP-grasp superfamily ATP-dependent carboligase
VTRATPVQAYGTADAPAEAEHAAVARLATLSREFAPDLGFAIHDNLDAVESEWRRFEQIADCTAFQSFDWLATWHRHIGRRDGVRPAIVVGSYADGQTAFILPLAIASKLGIKQLCWFGQRQCDYNAPLLARDFSQRVSPERFLAAWRELCEKMQRDPRLRHDWIELGKMPQMVGTQINPFLSLDVTANASGAHLTQLGDDWEKFYFAKRSSATRRRDRSKRRHMAEYGEIRFVTATEIDDARRTLETLIDQKHRAFARRGIPDIFLRPGLREFFLDLASNPKIQHRFHISRVEVGSTWAAANFAIVFGDCYYHVLASYEDDALLSHYGPGALHLRELLAHAIKLGLRRFDFTIGDEPYKDEWSDTSVKLYDYSAAATLRGWPVSAASMMRRRLKRFVKQTPSIWKLVSRLRATAGALAHPKASPRQAAATSRTGKAPPQHALACVMGDMDLLQPIAAAGIPCAVVTRPGVPSLYSRFARSRLPWDDFSQNTGALIDALERLGGTQSEPPVLFYEEDAQLLFISRHRERLAKSFRFVIADAPLVEDLLDKARFQELAQRHGLPVPPARNFHPIAVEPDDLGLAFPVVIKPLTRLERWNDVFGLRKALEVKDVDALRALWPLLLDAGVEVLAQRLIPGAEAQIESYHCYVDQRGSIAGEFTGRKIRTFPVAYGHTTALEITAAADVQRQGRDIVERLGLTGVAKLDFKRDRAGALHLLEINPRFTLWHHPAAVAGINIPALVYADLTGTPRPATTRAKAGVRWCRAWKDLPAARAAGVPLTTWLPWMISCEAKSALSWHDPMPLVRSTLYRLAAGHVTDGLGEHKQPRAWRWSDL